MMSKIKKLFTLEKGRFFLQSLPYLKFTYYASAVIAVNISIFISLIITIRPLLVQEAELSFQLLFWWGILGLTAIYLSGLLSRVLSLSSLFRFIIAYLLSLLISYIIYLGIHVNNPTIEAWDFIGNGFLQENILKIIALIFLLAYFIRYSRRLSGFVQTYLIKTNEKFIFSLLLTYCILNNNLFVIFLKQQFEGSLSLDSHSFFREFEKSFSVPFCLVLLASLIIYRAVCDYWNNRTSIWNAAFSSFLLATIFNYTLQLGIKGEETLLDKYIFQGAVSYQILILTVVFLLVYLIINRYIPATFFIVISFSIISIVNAIKESMRSEPLLVTDFTWLSEINTVAGFVDKKIISDLMQYLVVLGIFAVFLYFTILKGRIVSRWKPRLIVVAFLLGVLGSIYFIFSNNEQEKIPENIPILSNLNNKDDITWFGFTANARYKSLMYVWTKQLTKQVMTKPAGYSEDKIKEIVEKYNNLAKEINQSRIEMLSEQTVVFILSESFSNPEYVPNVQLSRDVMPNIKEIKAQTTSGIMKSDGYGGGTANMEFQALSGLPFRNFSPSVSIAYIEVVPKMDYFPSISHHFSPENRFVIHPASAKNYNRNIVYNDLAFGTFIAHHDGDKHFTSPVPVGALIGDWTAYSTVLENIQQEQSQFFSVITMQNHSPWLSDEPADVLASGAGYSEEENEKLTNYARLLSYTDEATQAFLDRLSELDKKVTVVFYGDHLPGLYPSFAFSERPEAQFQTDYFIWSNNENQKLEHPYLNSSDFTAALFEHTNAKVSPYIAMLTEMMRKASVNQVELTEEGKVVAADMYLLQYDLTVGKKYIQDYLGFFEIQ